MQLPKQKKNEDKIAMKTCDTMWRGMQKLSLSILEKKKVWSKIENKHWCNVDSTWFGRLNHLNDYIKYKPKIKSLINVYKTR